MKRLRSILALLAMTLMTVAPLNAQTPKTASTGGNSAHETTSTVVDGNRVTVTYGRPAAKGRKIWGELVPFGKVWRTGSDEATTLITQKDIMIGDLAVPAGAYTLYTQPEENGSCKLIVNKTLGQWGIPYSQKSTELGRVEMQKEATAGPVELFTIKVAKGASGGGMLQLSWENSMYSVPITTKK